VANVVRLDTGNPRLNLTDALMSYCNKGDANQDRIFQRVRERVPELQHDAVYKAFKSLVDSCHQSHHEVLREVSMQHPELVFQNDTQRRAFDALCELADVPVLQTPAPD
jgi:hypothetical protein